MALARYRSPMSQTAPMSQIPPGTPSQGAELADSLACLLHSHPETAFDYLEFRRMLAGQAAAFAAERADAQSLAQIAESLHAMEAAHALDDPAQEAAADAQFHLAIYEAAGNVVMMHIMQRVLQMLKSGVFYDRSDLYLRRGVRECFLRQHQAIYAAIAARDPAGARAAAEAHLASTEEALREAQRAQHRREVSMRRRDGLGLMVRHRRGE